MARKSELEELRTWLISLINEDQDTHAKLVGSLEARINETNECSATKKVLKMLYKSRRELLEKILKKVESI